MTFAQSLLWPASVLFGGAARVRAWSYRHGLKKQRRLSGTVISIGNLTVGGTGKTPFVCWLAERAAADGKRVGILTRGYRGSAGSSDEAEFLRTRLGKTVPVGVGADRFAKGKEIEEQGVEWFILDDGFQHLSLACDLDIVLIDASNPFGGGHLLPAGRLREPISALRRAGIVVITRSDRAPAIETVVRRYSSAPISYAQVKLERIEIMPVSQSVISATPTAVDRHAKKFFVFCGIGNSAAFIADLKHWGVNVSAWMAFRDHHSYSQNDMDEIERQARAAGADALLCTEKDKFNLAAVRTHDFPLAFCVASLVPCDPEGLWRKINSALERRLAGAAQ